MSILAVTRPSLISDELLRPLMAAGQADVLVGIPTLNNAGTIEPVMAAVHQAIAEGLAHHRVLIVNSDGGSNDGTQDRVLASSHSHAATVVASHSLRTLQRIVAPYHGIPGKRAAIRTLFAVADLLQTRAVAVIDPAATSPSADSLVSLLSIGLDGATDFVTPDPARGPRERPLVTQVVRPLLEASLGASFDDPLGEEFVASNAFVVDALRQPVWDGEPLRAGIDVWLRVHALAGPFRAVQLRIAPRTRQPPPAPPSLLSVVQQVLAATWTCMDLYAPRWTGGERMAPPVSMGQAEETRESPSWDLDAMARTCRDAVHELGPIIERVLPLRVVHALRASVDADLLAVGDEVWADVLVEYAAAWREGRGRAEDLAASFHPLYLGRAASFLHETDGLEPHAGRGRLDDLVRQVQQRRVRLVDAWRPDGPGGS